MTLSVKNVACRRGQSHQLAIGVVGPLEWHVSTPNSISPQETIIEATPESALRTAGEIGCLLDLEHRGRTGDVAHGTCLQLPTACIIVLSAQSFINHDMAWEHYRATCCLLLQPWQNECIA